jgi:hypothetical protein
LDQINWQGQDGVRNRIEGEARFLRAIMYFDLVRLFEKVPLLLEPTTANVPQAEVADVYKAIAEDLKFAAETSIILNIRLLGLPKTTDVLPSGLLKPSWAVCSCSYTGYYNATDLAVWWIRAMC